VTLVLKATGRTGRIGHRGLATSFYTDRDEPIASVLTRTLIETSQEIPDFLQPYVPDGAAPGNLKFEADSDFEEETAGADGGDAGGGGGWGAGDDGDAGNANGNTGGGGWGADDSAGNGNGDGNGNTGGGGWGADNGAANASTGW
jgi:ATP-dependent RNA helicase DDX3X